MSRVSIRLRTVIHLQVPHCIQSFLPVFTLLSPRTIFTSGQQPSRRLSLQREHLRWRQQSLRRYFRGYRYYLPSDESCFIDHRSGYSQQQVRRSFASEQVPAPIPRYLRWCLRSRGRGHTYCPCFHMVRGQARQTRSEIAHSSPARKG